MDKPIAAICCSTCKYSDKKITEEPCMTCNPWCDKWTECKPEVVPNEDNKV